MMFSFNFAFVYLSVVIFKTWDIKLGSVAFSADSGSVSQRATWFATFTVGFAFIHYMAAGRILIPILRIITAPFRILPTLLAVPVLVALGAAGAFFGFEHIPSETIAGKVAQWKTMMAADAGLTTMVVLATVGLPILFGILGGMLIGKKSDTG